MLRWIKHQISIRRAGARSLHRKNGTFEFNDQPLPKFSQQLRENGHCILRGVFSSDEIRHLEDDISRVFHQDPPDGRPNSYIEEGGDMFRYQMFNRSALCQQAIAHPSILSTVEPLLGNDCHVISNTAWRNPPDQKSKDFYWHIDGGPHVPLPKGARWPVNLPFPVFVIGTHIFLKDCTFEDGPTGVIPGSHKSGCFPPEEERWSDLLEFEGNRCEAQIAQKGDVGMFVSDVWHRRIPPGEGSTGRFFLQTNYARRDIAQRILTTQELNSVSTSARERVTSLRQQQLLGLHPEHYYDS
jgi:hypothetical protein